MDTIEATELVMSRIKNIDPQNASKIMGYVLIQDQSQNDMIRLAFGPETLLLSVIQQAKAFLDISSNTSSAPLSPSPFLHQTPPKLVIPNKGFHHTTHTSLSPHSPWSCMHFDLGFSDNGDRGFEDAMCLGGSSVEAIDGFQDLLRIKAMQQRRLGRSAEMGFGNSRPGSGSSSRQIYLTFPADSTFTGDDVSNYFSMFGPVEDVRIPYQQKRMFGFVAFVYPETVKSVLAKGNPHFICDSCVLVKPYKEKGTIPIKKHQHLLEPFDHIPYGARMFNHDMMPRRNVEGQDEFQQAIDFQERKLMNMCLTTEHHNLNVYGEEINGNDTLEGSDSKVLQEVNDDDDVDDREINSSNVYFYLVQKVEELERSRGRSFKKDSCHQNTSYILVEANCQIIDLKKVKSSHFVNVETGSSL
ncbi:zinc finger CCCH domain-containing protein 46-like [Bidens hawaiensis]|uniref:zinc finger CCCH domain-containing protein 46-like n=1 Tax=Bidens hawaiensis TaxID=980011 RepID=UPI00404BA17D